MVEWMVMPVCCMSGAGDVSGRCESEERRLTLAGNEAKRGKRRGASRGARGLQNDRAGS